MGLERIEVLLERIAVALERLAGLDSPIPLDHGSCTPAFATEPIGPVALEESVQAKLATMRDSVPARFLEARGIRIKALPPPDPADGVIDSLALFLGERYEALSSLLAKIKRAMATGGSFTESLRGRSQQDISSNCQFCTRLHEIAFLEEYQYSRSPRCLIRAKTTTLPKAQRFFAGQWLERFVLQRVKSTHGQLVAEVGGGFPLEYLINAQIVLPNGDDFELDILAAFGELVYWIEAKSGSYQQHVAKYAQFARKLGLDRDHCFMVLTDVPADRCQALSDLFMMTVCNLGSFEDTLLSVARADTAQLPHAKASPA